MDLGIPEPDWVVGSAYAGITFSYDVARVLRADHAFAEKDGNNMTFKRWEIPEGAVVLQIEELITTLKTAKAVREAVQRDNPHKVEFLPFIGTIVYRPDDLSKEQSIDGKRVDIIALLERKIWSVPKEECPLCKAGSKRLKPKENWKELTGN